MAHQHDLNCLVLGADGEMRCQFSESEKAKLAMPRQPRSQMSFDLPGPSIRLDQPAPRREPMELPAPLFLSPSARLRGEPIGEEPVAPVYGDDQRGVNERLTQMQAGESRTELGRYRVHVNLHDYSDHSDSPFSWTPVVDATTSDEALNVLYGWRDKIGDSPIRISKNGRKRYIGMISASGIIRVSQPGSPTRLPEPEPEPDLFKGQVDSGFMENPGELIQRDVNEKLKREIVRLGTAYVKNPSGSVSVKVVQHPSGSGYAVETTVNGDRRLPTESPMGIDEARSFAFDQLHNPRPSQMQLQPEPSHFPKYELGEEVRAHRSVFGEPVILSIVLHSSGKGFDVNRRVVVPGQKDVSRLSGNPPMSLDEARQYIVREIHMPAVAPTTSRPWS